jgi:hypothetical protein
VIIKRVAPLSAAKIAGLIYTLLGLPFALLVWVVSLVGLNDSGLRNSPFLPFSPAYVVTGGAVAVVVLPVLYGFFCFLMTLISAWLYNIVAGFVGGVSVELQVETASDAAV